MRTIKYNRSAAVTYAKKWALSRNPRYYNFDGLGGDCTNFASQCVFAGSGVMNYTKDVGWYYNSPADRAAAWSGVRYLHTFLTTNRGVGRSGKKRNCKKQQSGICCFCKAGNPCITLWWSQAFKTGFRSFAVTRRIRLCGRCPPMFLKRYSLCT